MAGAVLFGQGVGLADHDLEHLDAQAELFHLGLELIRRAHPFWMPLDAVVLGYGGLEIRVVRHEKLDGLGGIVGVHHEAPGDGDHDDMGLVAHSVELKVHREAGASGHEDPKAVLERNQKTRGGPAVKVVEPSLWATRARAVLGMKNLYGDAAHLRAPAMAPR